MKRLAVPAVIATALLSTACAETEQVCRTYGDRTVCRTERVLTGAARERRIDTALYTLDWTNCVERGEGSEAFCQARARSAQD